MIGFVAEIILETSISFSKFIITKTWNAMASYYFVTPEEDNTKKLADALQRLNDTEQRLLLIEEKRLEQEMVSSSH